MSQVLGIVTARGGSKSIPRKNIKLFAGKPLIAWAIESLKKSGAVDRVIVTTDDEEIASIAKEYGGEIPFMRPAELALDTTPSLPVLQHAVQWLKDNERYEPDYVVLLEPTSPSKRPFHIRDCVSRIIETGADSVISVAEVPGTLNPHWQIKLTDGDRVELFTGGTMKNVIRRRQDLPKTYFRNSSVYVFKPEFLFTDDPSLYGNDVRAYITESKYAIDIDTPEEWVIAEAMFKRILEEEVKTE